jgi:aminoglycoside phosphotransferase (APT) family kinase protein
MGESLPAIGLLTGPGAADVLAPALPAATRIEELTARQVTGAPGVRTTVRYDAVLSTSSGARAAEILVASVDRRGLPDGPLRVEAEGEEIAVWRAADDPRLPALALALDADRVATSFRAGGLDATGLRLRVRAYRPGSRAVVEAVARVADPSARLVLTPAGLRPRAEERRLYLKVLRPGCEAPLAEVHERMAGVMPVPRVLERHGDGLLVLDEVPGRTLRTTLRRERPVPAPRDVVALAVAPGPLDLPDRAAEAADDRVAWTLRLLRANLPGQRARVERLAARLEGAAEQPRVTIHGDFHEGQVLVAGGAVTGVIDLDDAGPGELVEDLGLIAGRLWTLARERGARHVEDYVAGLLRESAEHVPADELRRRVGVSLFARATAPFRTQMDGWRERSLGRLAICEEWLDRRAGA